MPLELSLFLLRLVSAALLISFMGTLFVLLWRELQQANQATPNPRQHGGELVRLLRTPEGDLPSGTSYPLRPLTSIGRAPTNTLILDHSFASSEHALIALRDGQWWLEDRRSRNGTLLNGEPVAMPSIITDGDIISIGDVHFRVILEP